MGFDGGIGMLVVGRSLTETGLSDTDKGAAAGRQAHDAANATERIVISNLLTEIFYTLIGVANYGQDV